MFELISTPAFWLSTAAAFAAAEGMSLLKHRLLDAAQSMSRAAGEEKDSSGDI